MPEPIRTIRPEQPDIKERLKRDLEDAGSTEDYERAVEDCEAQTRTTTKQYSGPKPSMSKAVQKIVRTLT